MPALFLAWMIFGIIATLPALSQDRMALLGVALLPAGAAWWSRKQAGMGDVWPLVAGVVTGGLAVWASWIQVPDPPPEVARQKVAFQAVVADREDRSDSVLLILDQVTSPLWNPEGLVRLSLYRQTTTVLPGDRVSVQARVRPVAAARNPGTFDYRQYLWESGVVATATAGNADAVRRIGGTDQWFWNRQRQRIADWIAATLPVSQQGLAEALLVGKRGHLDGALQNVLFVSGTFHLVAISGLHLSLVAGTVYFLTRLGLTLILPLSRRWDMKRPAALISLLPVTGYAFLAGWSVSTQRAYIMVGLFMLAVALRRQRQSWRLLTLAAVVILVLYPGQLLNAGFQLSFLCVAVILYLIDHLPVQEGWKGRLGLTLASTLAIGVVTAPLSWHAFHRISPYGMGINLVAIPWVGELATSLGLAAMVVQPLWSEAGGWLLGAMGWAMAVYRWLVEWSVQWPGAELRTPGPALPGMAWFVAVGLVAACLRHSGRWGWRRWALTLVAVLGLAWPRETTPDHWLRLIVLDVGQALSVVAKMPGGGWSVFDAGGAVTPRFDVGEAVISSVLWHHGVERLERVVVSHPQRDHMAGMARVLRNFPVGALWLSRLAESDENRADVKELLAVAGRLGVPVHHFEAAGSFPDGGAMVRVLPPLPEGSAIKSNDLSLIVEIEHGAHRFLLTGDMEAKSESWLLAQGVLHPVTVLLAPHHGSLTSSTLPFVRAVRPEHVVFSVGTDNLWGFPKPVVVRRWAEGGARIWRTDQHGAIQFVSDGTQLTVTAAP
ncbi:MAG: DNA internalization-related competence protein ComEC/Rec2 [Magnetococcales bacterium]|nr:DNA internalization-related competence protein ComEC/Rec2 [Magnetococcales bacterium]